MFLTMMDNTTKPNNQTKPMTDYDKSYDMTFRGYREHVNTAAEIAIENYELNVVEELSKAVEYAINGSNLIENYGYMLMTVLHSDQHPDQPEYCDPWTTYADLSDNPTSSDVISEMAYVCFYSDVMEKVKRMLEEDDE